MINNVGNTSCNSRKLMTCGYFVCGSWQYMYDLDKLLSANAC